MIIVNKTASKNPTELFVEIKSSKLAKNAIVVLTKPNAKNNAVILDRVQKVNLLKKSVIGPKINDVKENQAWNVHLAKGHAANKVVNSRLILENLCVKAWMTAQIRPIAMETMLLVQNHLINQTMLPNVTREPR